MSRINRAIRYARAMPSIPINAVKSIAGITYASSPLLIQIEPTDYCNQFCVFCHRQNSTDTFNTKHLSFDNFKIMIDKQPNLLRLMLSGYGEPLMNPHLHEMIKYCHDLGIITETNTNMSLLTKEKAKQLIESGLDNLFISLDSTDPETYKAIRGMSLDPVLKGLNNFVEVKREMKATKPRIIVNYVILNNNNDGYKAIIDVAKEKGLEINFKSMGITGAKANKFKTDTQKFMQGIRDYAKEKGVKVNLSIKHLEDKPFCYRIWFAGYINSNGEMSPCCDLPNNPKLGNLISGGMKDSWNSSAFQNFRKALHSRDVSKETTFVQSRCNNCNLSMLNDNLHKIGKYF